MKTLVIFAAWAPDDSENTQRWADWYVDVLNHNFRGCDKLIVVNHGTSDLLVSNLERVEHPLACLHVPAKLHVNSDACGFQFALGQYRHRLAAYDYVFFMHTKGISYDFASYDSMRPELGGTIFDYGSVVSRLEGQSRTVLSQRGHMSNTRGSIRECADFATRLRIEGPVFSYSAGLTLYYAPSAMVGDLLERLPSTFLEDNLLGQGFNRFCFEGLIPSMLVMLGGEPAFCRDEGLVKALNKCVSYDAYPAHNAGVVRREYGRREKDGDRYAQVPVPYVFGSAAKVAEVVVSYGT